MTAPTSQSTAGFPHPTDSRPSHSVGWHIVRLRAEIGSRRNDIQRRRLSCAAESYRMKRFAIVYLSTLIILLPLDFMFLGAVGKKLFADNVGDMTLASPRMAPAILFYVLYLAGVVIFVNGSAPSDWMHSLQYGALFAVLLRYVRAHQHGSAQALGMGGRRAGHRLGRGADGGFRGDRRTDCRLDIGENLAGRDA